MQWALTVCKFLATNGFGVDYLLNLLDLET